MATATTAPDSTETAFKPPPRNNLFRALGSAEGTSQRFELRAADDDGMPTLVGYFTRYNEWTEIDSFWEGRFLERISYGAFRKTFKEQAASIRCLFQHGRDSQVGSKPLGPIDLLREEKDEGPYYEVPLLETEYNRDLVPGLEKNLYGASFRMQVIREEINEEPGVSDHNPQGIPERTINEIRLFEFGPVTFPAYPNATAGVRSLTDWYLDHGCSEFAADDPVRFRNFLFDQLAGDPIRLRALVEEKEGATQDSATTQDSSTTTSTDERDEREEDNGDAGAGTSASTSLSGATGPRKPLGRKEPSWKLP